MQAETPPTATKIDHFADSLYIRAIRHIPHHPRRHGDELRAAFKMKENPQVQQKSRQRQLPAAQGQSLELVVMPVQSALNVNQTSTTMDHVDKSSQQHNDEIPTRHGIWSTATSALASIIPSLYITVSDLH
jgi:hypothetical protein